MATKPPSKRVDLLKDRNDKLAAQVVVHRQEVDRLQRTVDELQEKHETFEETVICVNRLWEELNGCIAFLQFRATGDLSNGVFTTVADADATLLEEANPFLAKLLTAFLPDDRAAAAAAEALTEDGSEVEAALRKRMAATMQAASAVLDSMEQLRSAGVAVDTSASPGGGEDRPGNEAQLAALNCLLQAENNRLRDQALQSAARLKELQTALADKEDEFLVTQRRLVQLRTAAAEAPPAGIPAAVKIEEDGRPAAQEAAAPSGPDLEHYKRLLEQRTEQVDERDTALIKAEREVRSLKDRLAVEREATARARRDGEERARRLGMDADLQASKWRGAAREAERTRLEAHRLQMELEARQYAEQRYPAAAAHVAELQRELADARAARDATQAALHRDRARAPNPQSAEEVQKLVDLLKADIARRDKQVAKHRKAAEGAAAARQAAENSSRELAEVRAQLFLAKERLAAARAAAAEHAAKERRWRLREADLKQLAQMSHSVLAGDAAGGADLAALRASEAALRLQVDQLRSEVQQAVGGSSLPQPGAEAALRAQMEALQEDNATLRARVEALERELADTAARADALESDDQLMRAIEEVTEAYESARAQSERLLAAITTRDEDNARLLEEAAATGRERAAAAEERDAAIAAARRAGEAVAAVQGRAAEFEQRAGALLAELDAAQGKATAMAEEAQKRQKEKQVADAAAAAAAREAEAARREAAARAAERDAEAERARREATRAERAEGEAAGLAARLQRLQTIGSDGAGGEVQAEVAALRKMVLCNVCHANYKDRIITKCSHLFCSHCISANLATRHRKCPGCSAKFGEGDVKPFYFT